MISDFSDVDAFFDKGKAELVADLHTIGKDAVINCKRDGNYQDRTGNLRAANKYEVESQAEISLTLKNEKEYASYVEAKGFNVQSMAQLEIERKLK